MYGTFSLRLTRQRLAELRRQQEEQRKEQVRQEAIRLAASSRAVWKTSKHHLDNHFGQEARREVEEMVGQAERLLRSDPDQALLLARRSVAAAERGLSEAQLKTVAWTKQKADTKEAVTILRLAVGSLLNGATIVDKKDAHLAGAARELAMAQTALQREDFETAKAAALKGQTHAEQANKERLQRQEQEEVRREVVRGLRQVLTGMGFTVQPPQMGNDRESGKVVLVGVLPAGKRARFVISLDGLVGCDFDGYQGRTCGKDHEKIRSLLNKCLQAESSDIEMCWKQEPIKIGRTERDFPTDKLKHFN
jgi:hypothetical protein